METEVSPADAQTRALCDELLKVTEGLRALGLRPHLIDQAIKKLKKQDAEITRHRSDRAYVIGHNDGWKAAFATGLPGGQGD